MAGAAALVPALVAAAAATLVAAIVLAAAGVLVLALVVLIALVVGAMLVRIRALGALVVGLGRGRVVRDAWPLGVPTASVGSRS